MVRSGLVLGLYNQDGNKEVLRRWIAQVSVYLENSVGHAFGCQLDRLELSELLSFSHHKMISNVRLNIFVSGVYEMPAEFDNGEGIYSISSLIHVIIFCKVIGDTLYDNFLQLKYPARREASSVRKLVTSQMQIPSRSMRCRWSQGVSTIATLLIKRARRDEQVGISRRNLHNRKTSLMNFEANGWLLYPGLCEMSRHGDAD